MCYSLIVFIILFIVIWIMHKPFDVHNTKFKRIYEYFEYALIAQGMIVLNEFLKYLFSSNNWKF